jgi:hypothetical protein
LAWDFVRPSCRFVGSWPEPPQWDGCQTVRVLLRLLALPNSLLPALILTRQFVAFWRTSFANSPKAESAEEKRLFSRSVFGATSATGAGTHFLSARS